MTTAVNPFKGKAKADGGGGDLKIEIPSADTHDARIVGLVDLGTHNEAFGNEQPKPKRQVYLVFELDEEISGVKGANHAVGVRYTLSFHEKATLRKLAEAILNEGQKYAPDADVDYNALLGQPCSVQIAHVSGKGDKADRKYVKVGTISAVPKKRRESVFKPTREIFEWYVGRDDLNDLPDNLPRIFGETVADVIKRCHELGGSGNAPGGHAASGEGEVGGNGGGKDIPF